MDKRRVHAQLNLKTVVVSLKCKLRGRVCLEKRILITPDSKYIRYFCFPMCFYQMWYTCIQFKVMTFAFFASVLLIGMAMSQLITI